MNPRAALLGVLCGGLAVSGVGAQTRDDAPSWTVYGDYRLRGAMDRERRSAPNRERIRMRLRLGADVRLIEGLIVGARLSTEPDPDVPNSPYVDLGDGFSRARFAFDRLFVRWMPAIEGERPLTVWAGKFPNPLAQPSQYGELMWDADVHPEGVAVAYEPVPELRLAVGGFSLLSQGSESDVNLGVVQASTRLAPAEDLELGAAVGGYLYGAVEGSAAVALADRNRGNELVRDASGQVTGFASDFRIWQTHGSLTYRGLAAPISLGAEYFVNAGAEPEVDRDAFAVSAALGALEGAGTGRIEYRYQDVGREAAYSSLVQDDFLDAVDFEGHIIGVAWRFTSFFSARGWTLWSRRPGELDVQRRFRLDLDFSWRTS
ncbi:MAG: putative porin [Gemmatimonadetes bacterium]|nr:putative porin [Gemmatimonadota bacterium]